MSYYRHWGEQWETMFAFCQVTISVRKHLATWTRKSSLGGSNKWGLLFSHDKKFRGGLLLALVRMPSSTTLILLSTVILIVLVLRPRVRCLLVVIWLQHHWASHLHSRHKERGKRKDRASKRLLRSTPSQPPLPTHRPELGQ